MSRLWLLPVLSMLLFVGSATIYAGQDSTTPLELNEPVTADLDAEFAFYELTLETPNILNFSLTSDEFDPLLTVIYLDTSETIVIVDDAQGTLNAFANDRFSEAGVYQIVVGSSNSTGRGEYTLSVTSAVDGVIEIGDTLAGVIGDDTHPTQYLISLKQGDLFMASVIGVDGVDTTLEFLDGLLIGTPYPIVTDYESGQGSNALLGPYQAPFDQILIISVSGYIYGENSSGEYTLSVESVATEPIACGDTIDGSLEAESTGNYYSIDLNHGTSLNIYADGIDSLDTAIMFYTTDSRLSYEDDDSGLGRDAEISDVSIWKKGNYTVGVRAYELATSGDYTLTIECHEPLQIREDAIEVVSDIKIGRNIFLIGDVEAGYTFELLVEGLENYVAYVYLDGNWIDTLDGEYIVEQSGVITIEFYSEGSQVVEYQISIIEG